LDREAVEEEYTSESEVRGNDYVNNIDSIPNSESSSNNEEVTIKDDNSIRILYNNCNGLQPTSMIRNKLRQQIMKKKKGYLSESLQYTKVSGIAGMMEKCDANIMCLSETQTAWEDYKVRNIITKEFKKSDRYKTLVGSSSDAMTASVYKPGGTAIVTDGSWSSRITERGRDPHGLGRWSFIKLIGKNNIKIMIICAYRCCKGQRIENVGETSSYFQQYNLLRKQGKKNQPTRAIHNRHEKICSKKRTRF